ncbi:MAG: thiamine diphosphokinase [Clostridiales bacterium]|nr:thiamine diphosphokinase [Clostridiales bacterium]
MTGVVVCGGIMRDHEAIRHYFNCADMVICADSGASHLKKLGITPDFLIGDMDSIDPQDLQELQKKGVITVRHPVEKDMTDSELALETAADKGCTRVFILGATGTRLDHSLANVFLLKRLHDKGISGIIADEKNELTLIDSEICLSRNGEQDLRISLIPMTPFVSGVTTEGLYYPLDNAFFEMGTTWGVSNEFTGDEARITIKEGLMLVVKSRD